MYIQKVAGFSSYLNLKPTSCHYQSYSK